jgi:hypothetical protein
MGVKYMPFWTKASNTATPGVTASTTTVHDAVSNTTYVYVDQPKPSNGKGFLNDGQLSLSVFDTRSGLAGKLIAAAFLIIVVFGGFWLFRYQLQAEQRLADRTAVLEQVVKEQNDFITKTKELQDSKDAAIKQLETSVATIQNTNKSILQYLDSPDAQKGDRPASDIIKKTLEELEKQPQ